MILDFIILSSDFLFYHYSGIDVYNCPVMVHPGGNVTKNNILSGSCNGNVCLYSFYSKPSNGTNLTLSADGKVCQLASYTYKWCYLATVPISMWSNISV